MRSVRSQGLYAPGDEHDACGVGFVVHTKGKKSHDIVVKALQVLINLEHRGACGCEANTGCAALALSPTSRLSVGTARQPSTR